MTSRLHRLPSLLLVGLTLLPIGCNPGSSDYLRGRGAREEDPAPGQKGSSKGRGDGDMAPSKDDPPPPSGESIDPNDPKVLSFTKDVKPILDRRCAECHHAGKDLDLTALPANTKVTMEKVLTSAGSNMPPSPREKMTADEITIVKAWMEKL